MISVENIIRKYLQETGFDRFSLKAVLFDMDGVLYDSLPNHAYSWVTVMRNYGLTMHEIDVYLNEGRIGDETIRIISKREGKTFDAEDRKRIYQEKTNLFNSCPPTPIMHGSLELLQKIVAKGLYTMLVTGSGQPSLIDRVSLDFKGLFSREKIITSFDVKNGKPHPELYLTALQKAGLNTCEAIVIENAPLGVEAACAAGLFVIAVNTGPLPDSTLLDAGANLLFPSLEALSDEWENVYNTYLLNIP